MDSSRTDAVSSVLEAPESSSDSVGGRELADRRLTEAMDRYVDGDAAAFDELYGAVASRVYGYVLSLVRDRARADDLLQRTFLRVHKARSAWHRGARVMPWIITIARNATYDEMRARRRAQVVLTKTGDVPEPATQLAADALDSDLVASLNERVARLPEPFREAILLTKVLDLTAREAATVAGTTEMAMKLRVHRAYKILRAELGHLREQG